MAALVLVVVVAVVGSALVAAERPPAPHYEIGIQRTANGIALQCHHGCEWVSLTGGCDKPEEGCSFVVDERGIRTLPAPAATEIAPGSP